MKTVKVYLPDKLAMEVENHVKHGWVTDKIFHQNRIWDTGLCHVCRGGKGLRSA